MTVILHPSTQVQDYLKQVLTFSNKEGLPKIIQKTIAGILEVGQTTVSTFLRGPTVNKLYNNFVQKFPNEVDRWPQNTDAIGRALVKADVLFFLNRPQPQAPLLQPPIKKPVQVVLKLHPPRASLKAKTLSPKAAPQSKATTKHKALLKKHLQEKIQNSSWVFSCFEDKSVTRFPYECSSLEVKRGSYTESGKFTDELLHETRPRYHETRPRYLVNIPMAYSSDDSNDVTRLLELFREHSFGSTPQKPEIEACKRLAIVIGINRISLRDDLDEDFRNYLKSLTDVRGIAYKVMGMFLSPTWQKKETANKTVFSAQRAYLVLKALSPNTSKDVLPPIPLKEIREKILHSNATKNFSRRFESSKSPLYYGVMDADTLELNGIFSHCDGLIAKHNTPSVVSCAYNVKTSYPLIDLGVRIDMKVRQAINSVIPFGAYLPEPFLFVRFRKQIGQNHLYSLSFLGKGKALESRRLIQNGRKKRVIEDTAVFSADVSIRTTTPARMFTQKNSKVTVLTPKVIKQKQRLSNLRAISQTHATPKQWADNIYAGLDFSTPQVTDATQPMMSLFQGYDPISIAFGQAGKYGAKTHFDMMMKNYSKLIKLDGKAREQLIYLGMTGEMVDQVAKAARLSGQAIYKELEAVARKHP